MRPAGALLILGACMAFAAVGTKQRRRRLQTLDGLDAALRLMEAEIEARAVTLPELAGFLSVRSSCGAARFFQLLSSSLDSLGERPFYCLWTACVRQALPELKETERQTLNELGRSLGRYSLECQTRAIRLCRDRLRQEAAAARESFARDRRLIWGLSFACGAFLLILLL